MGKKAIDNLKQTFIQYLILTPKHIGVSYIGMFAYGVFLLVCAAVLSTSIIYVVSGFTLSKSFQSPAELLQFEVTMAINGLIYQLQYYLSISIIIVGILGNERNNYILFDEIKVVAVKYFKVLIALAFTAWLAKYLLGLSLDGFSDSWVKNSNHFIATPLINMFFMVCATALIIGEKTILGGFQVFLRVLNVGRLSYVISLYVFCVASVYLPSRIVNIFKEPYIMNRFEDVGMEMTFIDTTVIFGFEILHIVLTVIFVSIPCAASVYTVRSIEKIHPDHPT